MQTANRSESADLPPSGVGESSRGGRWLWRAVLALAASAALVAAAPTICSLPPLRGWVLGMLFPSVQGSVVAENAALGWFSAPRLERFEIRSPDGKPVVSIEEVQLDRSLWSLLFDGRQLGTIRLVHPRLNLVAVGNTTNLAQTFPRGEGHGSGVERLQATRLAVEIVNGAVTWKLDENEPTWSVEKINLAGGLEPPAGGDGRSELVIRPGRVVDHVQVTSGMWNDVLVYVVPGGQGAQVARGEFSLEFGGGHFPLDRPQAGEFQGVLSLHSVTLENPSFLTRKLADLWNARFNNLQLPEMARLVDESTVSFGLKNERVYHRGFKLDLARLTLETEGTVGFDKSLNMRGLVRLTLPDDLAAKYPGLRPFRDSGLELPIAGTTNNPLLDWANFVPQTIRLGLDVAQQLPLGRLNVLEGALDAARDAGALGSPTGSPSPGGNMSAADVAGTALDIGIEVLRRNRERREAEAQSPATSTPPGGTRGAKENGAPGDGVDRAGVPGRPAHRILRPLERFRTAKTPDPAPAKPPAEPGPSAVP